MESNKETKEAVETKSDTQSNPENRSINKITDNTNISSNDKLLTSSEELLKLKEQVIKQNKEIEELKIPIFQGSVKDSVFSTDETVREKKSNLDPITEAILERGGFYVPPKD